MGPGNLVKGTMMISALHKADEHAPFSHYLVTFGPRVVRIKDAHTREIADVELHAEFVICHCGHWTARSVPSCECCSRGHITSR